MVNRRHNIQQHLDLRGIPEDPNVLRMQLDAEKKKFRDAMNRFNFKCLLFGDHEAGKTTFINRFIANRDVYKYPEEGFNLHSLVFESNTGQIGFNVIDIGRFFI